jgi:uncharacterized membrane protein YtjA (UPF0391 family)
MLWTLIVLLLVFWLLGFAFNVAGGIVHVLLVIAVVLFVVNLLSGRQTVVETRISPSDLRRAARAMRASRPSPARPQRPSSG